MAERQPELAKTTAQRGGGPPPGYSWNVRVLYAADSEARKLLTEDGYWHMVEQIQELARHQDPTHSDVLDLDKIEDFYELREKGGRIGKINLRVFFSVGKKDRVIVILGVIKKEAEGQTPIETKVTMRRRKRAYEAQE